MDSNQIIDMVRLQLPEMINIRRAIHSRPGLSFEEFATADLIRKELDSLGIKHYSLTDTDVIANIGSSEEYIALRADIDALPIAEETGLEYSSCNNGIMHACGHDMHTAMLMGTAKILKSLESELTHSVMLIFQPGEEKLPGGAKLIIDKGLFDHRKPMAIYGQHINPEAKTGTVASCAGPIMASTDELYISIRAKGTHAAQPHLGSDAVLTASQLVTALHSIVNKFRNPLLPCVLSITSIHGGSATNILPEEVKLMGTMRAYNQELREQLKVEIRNTVNHITSIYHCTFNLDIVEGYPAVINDSGSISEVKETAQSLFGNESYIEFEPKMWAEDFARYGSIAPSAFWFLGVSPDANPLYPLHNGKLNPDENAMLYGTAMLVALAMR